MSGAEAPGSCENAAGKEDTLSAKDKQTAIRWTLRSFEPKPQAMGSGRFLRPRLRVKRKSRWPMRIDRIIGTNSRIKAVKERRWVGNPIELEITIRLQGCTLSLPVRQTPR
jgi:hypothetical protein